METPSKAFLRKKFLEIRKKIPLNQKINASEEVKTSLLELTANKKRVLSFSSFSSEISSKELNLELALQKKLCLPKINGSKIDVYEVFDPKHDLKRHAWGVLEPLESRCQKVQIEELDFIIVPGLCFDAQGFRLGYGKGFYDNLLQNSQRQNSKRETVGIAFREQAFYGILPRQAHDQRVQSTLFF